MKKQFYLLVLISFICIVNINAQQNAIHAGIRSSSHRFLSYERMLKPKHFIGSEYDWSNISIMREPGILTKKKLGVYYRYQTLGENYSGFYFSPYLSVDFYLDVEEKYISSSEEITNTVSGGMGSLFNGIEFTYTKYTYASRNHNSTCFSPGLETGYQKTFGFYNIGLLFKCQFNFHSNNTLRQRMGTSRFLVLNLGFAF